MPTDTTDTVDSARRPLTRERVLEGAIGLADRIGIQPLTIRKLADELGTKPMTIYHHVENKDAILDGMVDAVFAEIDLPPSEVDWKQAIRARCLSARAVLSRHSWATPLMESRTTPGRATLRHHDAVIATFLRGGMSMATAAHAYAIVDSYVYGFALQEATLVTDAEMELTDVAEAILASPEMEEFPDFAAFTVHHVLQPGYDFGSSFEIGLDLLLDGLEAMVDEQASD